MFFSRCVGAAIAASGRVGVIPRGLSFGPGVRILVMAQLEDIEVLDHLDDILAVDGIALFRSPSLSPWDCRARRIIPESKGLKPKWAEGYTLPEQPGCSWTGLESS